MTTKDLYYKFHLLLNKNNENSNINVEVPNFVLIFNREAKKWLHSMLDKYNSNENIFNLQELLVTNKKLISIQKDFDKIIYSLPEDYLTITFGDNYSIASKGECEKKLFNYFIKPNDVNSFLEDKFTTPDFDWERGLASLSSKNLIVYKSKDYKIKDTFISYYKIEEIDLEGYTKIDGSYSITKNPSLSDYYLDQILDRVVVEFTRQFSNPQDLQIALERESH